MSRLTVEQWEALVFANRDKGLTPAAQVLCLWLVKHMRGDRKVSVPRTKITKGLDIHNSRVAERFARAVDAGYLVRVGPGYKGHTAEYQATRPDEVSVLQSGTHSEADRESKHPAQEDASKHRGAGRNEGGPERAKDPALQDATSTAAPTRAFENATPNQCRGGWHAAEFCTADCLDDDSRRTA